MTAEWDQDGDLCPECEFGELEGGECPFCGATFPIRHVEERSDPLPPSPTDPLPVAWEVPGLLMRLLRWIGLAHVGGR